MKKRIFLAGSLAFLHFWSKAQEDTTTTKVSKTAIELVYNHYAQDGNNSAVTGGIGTERLTVYGPSLSIKNTSKKHGIAVKLGSDIISSASTDKIDFVQSSASSKDARTYINGSYERQLPHLNSSISLGLSSSIESDYFSVGSQLGFSHEDKKRLRNYFINFQFYNDDLRWGRLDYGNWYPQYLIYPQELRGQEWYSSYKRYSFNLKTGIFQAINKKNILGLFPEVSYQEGLLATPFHRTYFSDGSLRVEKLPSTRLKGALALRLHSFIGGSTILKNTIDTYKDDFGITAFGIENETALKLMPHLTLLPNIRFYTQTAARYFAPYKEHKVEEEYYTSDYDLSAFNTLRVGLGVKFSPKKYISKQKVFNSAVLRYSYYHRTNGLKAHIFSLVLQASSSKTKK